MTRIRKPGKTDRQEPQADAGEKSDLRNGVARTQPEARGWASVNRLQGGGKKIAAGRKIPSGPVGGSGRKTNLARSS